MFYRGVWNVADVAVIPVRNDEFYGLSTVYDIAEIAYKLSTTYQSMLKS